MVIYFTKYAKDKFGILAGHGCVVERALVEEVAKAPDFTDDSKAPLFSAQKDFDEKRLLKVVYKKEAGAAKIITFNPAIKNNEQ